MKIFKTALLSILAALGMTGGLYAATTLSGDLTADVTENDELIIPSGATIDLKGYNLTLNGKLTVQGAATITNSDTGDVKDAKFYVNNNPSSGLANLTFSGNLRLVVGGECSSNGNFQWANNTHTGGTVLDGFNASGNARFSKSTFGTGDLTLKNGSYIYHASSSSYNIGSAPWPNFTSTGDNVCTNTIKSEQSITITGAVHIATGNLLRMRVTHSNAGYVALEGDLSDIRGTLWGGATSKDLHLTNPSGIPNGTVRIDPSSTIRFYGARTGLPQEDGDYCYSIGALETPPDINVATNAYLVRTQGSSSDGYVRLKVGGLNTDTEFYGIIEYQTDTKDWRVEKVGTGTLTLGGKNAYRKGTILTQGAIRLVGDGQLGNNSYGDITFNGGEIIFGDATVADVSSRFKTNSGKTAKIGVDEGVTYTMAGTLASCGDLEKTRNGTLILSSAPQNTGNIKISAGTLVVPAGSSLKEVTIEDGGVLAVAGSAEWVGGDTKTISFNSCTTLEKDKNFIVTGLGDHADYTISQNSTSVTITISKVLVWTGASGSEWTASDVWNTSDTFAANDPVCFNDASFGDATELTVNIGSDVVPKSIEFKHTEGHNLILAGNGIINLTALTNNCTGKVTLANGKNPFTTLVVNSGTLALGADQPLSTETATLYLNKGATLDLNGHNLFVGTATVDANTASVGNGAKDDYDTRTATSVPVVTNSNDSVMGTFTAGCGNNYAYANRFYRFGGNVRYVTTGKEGEPLRFWGGNNYHTGGTVMSNVSHRVRSPEQFGTGRIIVAEGAKWDWASSNPSPYNEGQSQRWVTNDFEVVGFGNTLSFGAYSGNGEYTVSSGLYGDSDAVVTISAGWQHSVKLTGDVSAFEGTLTNGINNATSDKGLYFQNQSATGLPNADVVMHLSSSASNTNKIFVAGAKSFGSLTTDDTSVHANAFVYARDVASTLKVGSKAGGTFAGNFCDYSSAILSVEKVGADTTWTLTGTNHNFSGTFTVTGGKVVFANPQAVALGSQVVVGANGTISGSGLITSPVSFTSGAQVEVAAGGDTLTFSSDIDASTLTVKLTGTLTQGTEYTILTAGSGSSGTASLVTDNGGAWMTTWDNGTLKAYYGGIVADNAEVGYVEGTTAVITNTAAESITLPSSGLSAVSVAINSASGQAALVSSGLALTTANVTVYATDASGNKMSTAITGAFKVTASGTTYTITLDDTATVNGVSVTPAVDTAAEQPMSIADGSVGLAVKTIPGLWYGMKTCTTPGGTYSVDSDSVKQADGSSISLSSAIGSDTVKFYKVVTGASKASLTTNN